MSEPHIIGSPQQQLLAAADAVCEYCFNDALEDYLQKASDNNWDLNRSRPHIFYNLCLLEWHLRPTLEVNPDRYFLRILMEELDGRDEYERLHPNLMFHDPDQESESNHDDPPFVEDHHSDNRGCYNPYPD
ncbi:MAG: hypothetical protein WBM08_14540 [Prochlorococcaceae cyanobacterium]